jgi:diguanylate cyclase (GGDEF)-like protein
LLYPWIPAVRMALHSALALIVAGICLPFSLDGHAVGISASIGVATYPQHGTDQEQLIKSADQAMYHAKQRGGGAVFSFGQLATMTA